MKIGPLLAGAGIIGLAVGFGGQYLIKDLIAGLFIIIENQFRVGDVVNFEGTAGVVEEISLRMTTLRDLDGTVHFVPHGEIKKAANLTRYFSRVNEFADSAIIIKLFIKAGNKVTGCTLMTFSVLTLLMHNGM